MKINSSKSILQWILFLLLNFSLLLSSYADLVYLKNGKIIEGQVKSSEGNVLIIDTPGGIVSMPKNTVDRVQRQANTIEVIPYLIEVASQVRKEDAERALNYLKSQGFASAHLTYEAPYYKVQVGPFTKEQEAISRAQAIDKLPVPFASANKAQVVQGRTNPNQSPESPTSTMIETNIALAVNGAKVTGDSQQPGYSPSKIIDGNTQDANSRWISQNSPGPHWVIIDFNEPKPFYRIEVYSGEEHDSRYILKDFTVQYWTGTEWKDVGGVRNNLVENPVFNFDAVTSQRVRIYVNSANYKDNTARIFEVKILSRQSREVTALPTEQRIRYDFDISEPVFLKEDKPILRVHAGDWYTLSIKISYDIGTVSAFTAVLNPDAQDFWSNTQFRDYLNAKPENYGQTVAFDTKNDPSSQNITGQGLLTFELKSRSPEKSGEYNKIIRCNLYNPTTLSAQKTRVFPFTLLVE